VHEVKQWCKQKNNRIFFKGNGPSAKTVGSGWADPDH